MRLKLVKLSKKYKSLLEDMLEEWIAYNNENPEANHSPWAIFKNDYHDFDYYLKNLIEYLILWKPFPLYQIILLF